MRWFAAVGLALALALVFAPGALAQTTPREQQAALAADAMLANLAAHVADRQAAYLLAHGRYFQGIRTHRQGQTPGVGAPPETSRRPTDQAEDWNGAGFSLPPAIELHVYDGPAGKGYTAIIEVLVAGKRWRRAESSGPESAHRTHAWREVKEVP